MASQNSLEIAARTADQIATSLDRLATAADQVGGSIPDAVERVRESVEAAQERIALGREAVAEVALAVGALFDSLAGLMGDVEGLFGLAAPPLPARLEGFATVAVLPPPVVLSLPGTTRGDASGAQRVDASGSEVVTTAANAPVACDESVEAPDTTYTVTPDREAVCGPFEAEATQDSVPVEGADCTGLPNDLPGSWDEVRGLGEHGIAALATQIDVDISGIDNYARRAGVVWARIKILRGDA